MKFERLNLHDNLLKGITKAGFKRCMPVQEQSLPESLIGKDIIVQSQTGTGKTAVFLLTILNKLTSNGQKPGVPRALIMVPTRELALQIDQDTKKIAKYLPYRSLAVYGGVGYEKQELELSKGVDIIVATPGRMIDLYKSKTLSLSSIDQFVIDEADRMFDMGFIPDIRYIANHLPRNKARQTMLFSATIESRVIRLGSRYMKPDPVLIEIEPEQITVDLIDQKLIYVSNEEKLSVFMGLLKRPDIERVIIFTNMKRTAEMVGWKLDRNGFPVEVITGDVSQPSRQRIMNRMKSGKVKFLVATEVAARGLHIENVSHVINYDLPNEAANYVHRIGRTARAGKAGKAYSLVCEDHVLNLPDIESFIDRKIEKEWLDESEMVKDQAGAYKKVYGTAKKDEKKWTQKRSIGKGVSFATSKKTEKGVVRKKENVVRKKANSGSKRKNLPSSAEERIAYYKKKYGEEFLLSKEALKTVKKTSTRQKKRQTRLQSPNVLTKKPGIFKKIFNILGK